MAGIYIHIPFCRQACHYCDFHFSTTLKHRKRMLQALKNELRLRKHELGGRAASTLYFGGGTPSLLLPDEILEITEWAGMLFGLEADAEVTLEANPDDLHAARVRELAAGPVNRLSIGVQSFREAELRWMNRAHSAAEARSCLEAVAGHFDNFSIDLIYGLPGSSLPQWEESLQEALSFDPPHISAYALTVEPSTALKSFIDRGISPDVDEDRAEADFRHLVRTLEAAGYDHYEISNFGKPGYHSRNNTAYWQGEPYIGIGPSAHSFDGRTRRWNVAHNLKYMVGMESGEPDFEAERLSTRDRYNEAVMTGLRTWEGVALDRLRSGFGPPYVAYLLEQAAPYLQNGLLEKSAGALRVTEAGKFLADGIASDLFMINLK